MSIDDLFDAVPFHDAEFVRFDIDSDGKAHLFIDIDEPMRKTAGLDANFAGVMFPKVYEVTRLRQDGVGVISDGWFEALPEYDRSPFHGDDFSDLPVGRVDIKFVAHSDISFICVDQAKYIIKKD